MIVKGFQSEEDGLLLYLKVLNYLAKLPDFFSLIKDEVLFI